MRHPKEMGATEVEVFLTMLANERQVSSSTHRQALNAILFLYRDVLCLDLPWLTQMGCPPERKRIPVVLTVAEVQMVLGLMRGVEGLMARLLYGSGMRLNEGLSLRVKDVDFDWHVIVVRSGKGDKDRVVMLPRSLEAALREQLAASRAFWAADRAAGRSGVYMPHALDAKYPRASLSWAWHWVFPAPSCQLTRAQVWSGGITFMKDACRVRSNRFACKWVLPSMSPYTHCATHLPHICCKGAPTFARCRSCWATAMCPPP
ncbi:MAG: hypothetical protein RJB34_1599 [Pseudomonadota bacterium]